jgi:hypothetical protein
VQSSVGGPPGGGSVTLGRSPARWPWTAVQAGPAGLTNRGGLEKYLAGLGPRPSVASGFYWSPPLTPARPGDGRAGVSIREKTGFPPLCTWFAAGTCNGLPQSLHPVLPPREGRNAQTGQRAPIGQKPRFGTRRILSRIDTHPLPAERARAELASLFPATHLRRRLSRLAIFSWIIGLILREKVPSAWRVPALGVKRSASLCRRLAGARNERAPGASQAERPLQTPDQSIPYDPTDTRQQVDVGILQGHPRHTRRNRKRISG